MKSLILFCLFIFVACMAPRRCWHLNFRNYSNESVALKVGVGDTTYMRYIGAVKAGALITIPCITSDSYRGNVVIFVNKKDSVETKTYTIAELRNMALTIIYKNQLP